MSETTPKEYAGIAVASVVVASYLAYMFFYPGFEVPAQLENIALISLGWLLNGATRAIGVVARKLGL